MAPDPSIEPELWARPSAVPFVLAAAVVGLVAWVYRDAATIAFFNDDFHWLYDTRRFSWSGLVDLDRYNHFYRPVVSLYFVAGQRLFGCEPAPFHALSVAIHLLNCGLLGLLAWRLTRCPGMAAMAAVLFCVQPGYVEAVVWVGAITDLLPATWFLLVLWLHLVWLQDAGRAARRASFAVFAICLGTHESAVTMLPMMFALDVHHSWPATGRLAWLRARVRGYAGFAAMLAVFLAVAWVVNSRSYLVREGYYTAGWHMVSNLFSYFAGMYVGRRRLTWHLAVAAVLLLLAWRGSPRVRFLLVWLLVTLAPVLPFTWGTASRYLYVPSAAFALLLADRIHAGALALRRAGVSRRIAAGAALVLVVVLTARFGWFARGGVNDFRRLARPFEHFTAVVREADRATPGIIRATPGDVVGIEATYIDPAAETALCRTGVHVVVE
jgi:hypothetical protein